MNKLVLDANIFVKLFRKEHDTAIAISLVRKISAEAMDLIAPAVLINETMHTCEYRKIDRTPVYELFRNLLEDNLELINTTPEILDKTFEITQHGHPNSGYPTFSDSMYHAVALENDALFITADTKHIEKVKKKYKNAVALRDWEKYIF